MRRALQSFGRALCLRCPDCGGGPLFRTWLDLRDRCPGCGLWLEREPGYYMGAMLINIIVAELLFVATFVVVLVRTWPSPPWTWLTYGSVVAVVLFPVLLFPFTRTIWLAFDLLIQPARPEERQRSAPPPPRAADDS